MKTLFAAALLFLALALAGCSVPLDKAILGRYHGELDITGTDKRLLEPMKRAATGLKGSTIDIKEGGKATFAAFGQSGAADWKLEGFKLSITPDGSDQPIEFLVSDGGAKLTPVFTERERAFFRGAKPWFKKE